MFNRFIAAVGKLRKEKKQNRRPRFIPLSYRLFFPTFFINPAKIYSNSGTAIL